MYFDCTIVFRICKSAPTANELSHANANTSQAIDANQIAHAPPGVCTSVFSTPREA